MIKENYPWLLIVDDDETNLYSTKRVLTELAINIKTVLSGEEALRAILNEEYFLILMDVQMPGMDGFETLANIRGSKNFRSIPVIFQTAISKDEKHVMAGYKEGAVDYLFKPVNADILKSKVQSFLDLFKSKVELAVTKKELKHAQEVSRSTRMVKERLLELDSYDNMVANYLQVQLHHIKEYLASLKNELPENVKEKVKDYLQGLEKDTNIAGDAVEGLMQYLKVDKFFESKSEFNLRECIDKSIKSLESIELENNAQITFSNLPLQIFGNPEKIQQMFVILFSNSLRFNKKSVPLEIEVYGIFNEDTKSQKIIVKDNGIGFKQENADEIFVLFKTLQVSRESKSAGIGLATCKKIVELHDWNIRAEGNISKGATFIISIPSEPEFI